MQIHNQLLPDAPTLTQRMSATKGQMLRQLLQEQGVHMSANGGIRLCLTQQQLDARALPVPLDEGCQRQVSEQHDGYWVFDYQCPDELWQGEAEAISDREFLQIIQGTGQNRVIQVNSHSRWIGEDCSDLQPL